MRRARRAPAWLLAPAALLLAAAVNWGVQVWRKPAELAGLVLPSSGKSPRATWDAYGGLFVEHATGIMSPELLAALAQAESSGDPAARTYWRWRWTVDPFRLFAPASSAVGLYQVTDGTLERCRDVCVRGGEVERARAWYDPRGCWFNGAYNRLVPSHAVELVAACLHRQAEDLAPRRATTALKQDLAVVSHLCGPRARAVELLRRTGSLPKGERCGSHDPREYLRRVRALRSEFAAARLGL